MYESLLTSIGLSNKEARVYEAVLDQGRTTVPELVKQTSLTRGIVHFLLTSLEKKGLVAKIKANKQVSFSTTHPNQLQNLLETKERSLDSARQDLQTGLPAITSHYNLNTNKPGVHYLEGVEGLKKVYEDTLKVGLPISAVLQTENVEPNLYKWLTTTYVRNRIKKSIPVRSIVSSDKDLPTYVSRDELELRQSKVVPKKQFPFAMEVTIYGDKVAFLGHNKESGLVAAIVENPKIAQTMRAWFELTWLNL